MSQVNDIAFTLNGVTYKYRMTYHPDNPCDKGMMEEFQKWGCCEPELLHVMQRVIKPGDFVIDGGANVGCFTILMSQMVGEKGKVLAIEPGENNLWKLEKNLKLNKIKNVEIVRKPLWRKHEKIRFYLSRDPGLNSIGMREGGYKEYETVTLADYPQADFIKLDVEGAEEAVLSVQSGCPWIVAELNENAMKFLGSTQQSFRKMMEFLYDTFLIHKNGTLPSLIPQNTHIRPTVSNANLLFSTLDEVGEAWSEVRI